MLLVENLNMLFRDMADADAGWRLRKVLQTEPRIVLLASATSRFDEIDDPKHALYDLFSVRTLRPLDTDECATLWEAVAGRRPQPRTVRSIEILTGGSPRLVAIVARFGAELSFRKLMANLLDLIDDHTEYFKSHIESAPGTGTPGLSRARRPVEAGHHEGDRGSVPHGDQQVQRPTHAPHRAGCRPERGRQRPAQAVLP